MYKSFCSKSRTQEETAALWVQYAENAFLCKEITFDFQEAT